MSKCKKELLKDLLSEPDFVCIEVCNPRVYGDRTGTTKVRLVSGVPENDEIIETLRKSL